MSPLDRTRLMLHEQRPDAVMVRGAGSWLWDERGRRYLDFVQGWAVNCLGHSPPLLRRALAAQARTLVNPSPAFLNAPQLELAAALADAAGLDQVFLASTGAEANEGAVKLARKWGRLHRGGAFKVITTVGGFHGRTLAMTAASGKPGWDDLFPPILPGFVKVPYGDVEAVAGAIDDQTAAVMVEPIQGEGGVVVPPPDYLRSLRALADQRRLLLILDEVQTGMGRTGTLFAHQRDGITPDVLTLGKGLGGGVPLAALLATRAASCFAPGEQGGTYAGTPLMAAAGLAVLRAVTAPGFLDAVTARARQLEAGLRALADRFGCPEVRGQGLLQALRLPAPVGEAIVTAAREICDERELPPAIHAANARGTPPFALLLNAPRPDLLRFMPALTVSAREIALMLRRLGQLLAHVLSPGAAPSRRGFAAP
jgi:acetylornithine/N-succinyldiaminopimelate aminotransferase